MSVVHAPDVGMRAASGSAREVQAMLDIFAHLLRLGLDQFDPVFHQIADRHEALDLAAVGHRQMADPAFCHQRQGFEHARFRVRR